MGPPPPYKNAGVTVFNVSVKQTTWLCPKPMKVGFDLKSLTGIPRNYTIAVMFRCFGDISYSTIIYGVTYNRICSL